MKLDKKHPALVGFMQALGIVIYCLLISSFFNFIGQRVDSEPQFLGTILFLFLLVFSAALCGTLVFAYPSYLLIQKETKRALTILGYTFLYAVIIFILILLTVIL